MRDFALIADALADVQSSGESAVLATVVRTEGSVYRRAGARMLLRQDGRTIGAVSGGCLEADLAARADELLAAGRSAMVTYDSRAGADLVWGLGLGCNGRVDVLLEPLVGDAVARARLLHAACRDVTAPAVLSTVIAAPDGRERDASIGMGDRMMVSEAGGAVSSGLSLDATPPELVADAWEALRAGRSAERSYVSVRGGPGLEVLHEIVLPPLSLLVCGAGADALPLVRMALAIGWRVTVADHRPDHARPDRFPGATVVALDGARAAIDDVVSRGCDAAVVMSHHFERDAAHVRAVLATAVPYVGVLGPRRRTEQMLSEIDLSVADLARVYAPVGLDIGAETPDEIALAIVAEVQAVRARRQGGPLRERAGGIHAAGTASSGTTP